VFVRHDRAERHRHEHGGKLPRPDVATDVPGRLLASRDMGQPLDGDGQKRSNVARIADHRSIASTILAVAIPIFGTSGQAPASSASAKRSMLLATPPCVRADGGFHDSVQHVLGDGEQELLAVLEVRVECAARVPGARRWRRALRQAVVDDSARPASSSVWRVRRLASARGCRTFDPPNSGAPLVDRASARVTRVGALLPLGRGLTVIGPPIPDGRPARPSVSRMVAVRLRFQAGRYVRFNSTCEPVCQSCAIPGCGERDLRGTAAGTHPALRYK
jgi:hypothetical protein